MSKDITPNTCRACRLVEFRAGAGEFDEGAAIGYCDSWTCGVRKEEQGGSDWGTAVNPDKAPPDWCVYRTTLVLVRRDTKDE